MYEWINTKQCIIYVNNLLSFDDPEKIIRIAWLFSKQIYKLIEIKIGHDWKCGIGQLLAYGEYYKDHVKRLHLFDFKYDEKIAKLCEKYNIKLSYEIITPP